jgi:hypothetical protein
MAAPAVTLSRRECEAALLIAERLPERQIAARLGDRGTHGRGPCALPAEATKGHQSRAVTLRAITWGLVGLPEIATGKDKRRGAGTTPRWWISGITAECALR